MLQIAEAKEFPDYRNSKFTADCFRTGGVQHWLFHSKMEPKSLEAFSYWGRLSMDEGARTMKKYLANDYNGSDGYNGDVFTSGSRDRNQSNLDNDGVEQQTNDQFVNTSSNQSFSDDELEVTTEQTSHRSMIPISEESLLAELTSIRAELVSVLSRIDALCTVVKGPPTNSARKAPASIQRQMNELINEVPARLSSIDALCTAVNEIPTNSARKAPASIQRQMNESINLVPAQRCSWREIAEQWVYGDDFIKNHGYNCGYKDLKIGDRKKMGIKREYFSTRKHVGNTVLLMEGEDFEAKMAKFEEIFGGENREPEDSF